MYAREYGTGINDSSTVASSHSSHGHQAPPPRMSALDLRREERRGTAARDVAGGGYGSSRLQELDDMRDELARPRPQQWSSAAQPEYFDRDPLARDAGNEYVEVEGRSPQPLLHYAAASPHMSPAAVARSPHPYCIGDEPAAAASRTHHSAYDAAPAYAAPAYTAPPVQQPPPLEVLRGAVPFLSPGFSCGAEDAALLLDYIAAAAAAPAGGRQEALEDKVVKLEADAKALTQRLQRRTDEAEHLKDVVADARGKQAAVERETKAASKAVAQRRDDIRKQLLMEESRTSKLQFQNKTLLAEIDKLKARVHQQLGGRPSH
jgi:hypothetical protein